MVLDYGICSSDSRDDLYVELLCDDVQFGEIILDEAKSRFSIKLYSPLEGDSWLFDFNEFRDLVERALEHFKSFSSS